MGNATGYGNEHGSVADRLGRIRDLARRLSPEDLEELEGNLKALEGAVAELRRSLPPAPEAPAHRRFEAACPSVETPEKVDVGPAVSSDPNAIG